MGSSLGACKKRRADTWGPRGTVVPTDLLPESCKAACVQVTGDGSCPVSGRPVGSGECPLKHGTVWARPYPGYVHGRRPAICQYGCKPRVEPHLDEAPRQKLLREAREFQELYHAENRSPPGRLEQRIQEIAAQVKSTGTYSHTVDELRAGARIAWRNAPKCANRKFWNTIEVIDQRDVTTNEGMFRACMSHLKRVQKDGVTKAYITIFPPQDPKTGVGPRIWSGQLIRFAAFELDGGLVGDPANLGFTRLVQDRFDWKPQSEKPSAFEVLPIVVQAAGKKPESFELPPSCRLLVDIWHPDHPWLSDLGMKWTGVPAVSDIVLEIGGLTYSAVPFNGWFADTELCRDLGDPDRYNMLPAIAQKLRLPTENDSVLWKDEAMLVLSKAIMHSFSHADYAIVDHHTMLASFYTWYQNELRTRGWCPGNWKWVIPPLTPTLCKAYMGLNRMTEYTLKPVYSRGPGWERLAKAEFGSADAALVKKRWSVFVLCARALGRWRRLHRQSRVKVLLVYATANGSTRRFASLAATMLEERFVVTVMDAEAISPLETAAFEESLAASDALVVLSASYGQGDPPDTALGFYKVLQSGVVDLSKKLFAVCGFGNSGYKNFCGAATKFDDVLTSVGGDQMCEVARCDELGARQSTFDIWLVELSRALQPVVVNYSRRSQLALHRTSALSSSSCLPMLAARSSIQFSIHRRRTLRYTSPSISSLFPFQLEFIQTDNVTQVMTHLLSDAGAEQKGAAEEPEPARDRFFQARSLGVIALFGEQEKWCSSCAPGMALVRLAPEIQVPFTAGDHIAVIPHGQQFYDKIDSICEHLSVEPDDVFFVQKLEGGRLTKHDYPLMNKLQGKRTTMRLVLSTWAGLGEPLAEVDLAAFAPCAVDSQMDVDLLKLASTDPEVYRELVKDTGLRWADLFDIFPSLVKNISLELYLTHLPLNHARMYSVASSPRVKPGEIHLIVSRCILSGKVDSRKGVASDDLTCLQKGTSIQIQPRVCRDFHLPVDPMDPVVFVAVGSGLAPIRSFLQERAAFAKMSPLGRAVLFYGCRSRPSDFMQAEFDDAKASGVLSHLILAVSEVKPKLYVQDHISQSRKSLKSILNHPNCEFYLCGGNSMIDAVTSALSGGSSAWLQKVKQDGRWHVDAFGLK